MPPIAPNANNSIGPYQLIRKLGRSTLQQKESEFARAAELRDKIKYLRERELEVA